MRPIDKPLLVLLLSATVGACAPRTRVVYVYAPVPPPVAVRESRAVPPGRGYVWVPGHHRWEGHAYLWVPGRWELPPPHRSHWVAGHWSHDRHGWYWINGHWA